MITQPATIMDFSDEQAVADWYAIDDRIMGGASESSPAYVAGSGLRFSGEVSLENNGGFASIRSGALDLDLGTATGLVLRVRGDGRRYKLSLRTDSYFDGISYQAEFSPEAGCWCDVPLPFDVFVATHHGQRLSTVAPMDPSHIESIGIFIANRTAESFCLDIAWIGTSS